MAIRLELNNVMHVIKSLTELPTVLWLPYAVGTLAVNHSYEITIPCLARGGAGTTNGDKARSHDPRKRWRATVRTYHPDHRRHERRAQKVLNEEASANIQRDTCRERPPGSPNEGPSTTPSMKAKSA